MSSLTPDAELIAAARLGDPNALPTLFAKHQSSLLQIAQRITGSRWDAEDAVSEAFLGLLRAIKHGLGPSHSTRAYLVSSVRRAAVRHRRPRECLGLPETAVIENLEERHDDQLAVRAAFATLPARWRVVLWLTEVEGLTRTEAAPLVGTSANAVAMTASRARQRLRVAYLRQSA